MGIRASSLWDCACLTRAFNKRETMHGTPIISLLLFEIFQDLKTEGSPTCLGLNSGDKTCLELMEGCLEPWFFCRASRQVLNCLAQGGTCKSTRSDTKQRSGHYSPSPKYLNSGFQTCVVSRISGTGYGPIAANIREHLLCALSYLISKRPLRELLCDMNLSDEKSEAQRELGLRRAPGFRETRGCGGPLLPPTL